MYVERTIHYVDYVVKYMYTYLADISRMLFFSLIITVLFFSMQYIIRSSQFSYFNWILN